MTGSKVLGTKVDSFIRWVVSALLLALPFLFLFLGFQREFDVELERTRLETRRDMEKSLLPFLSSRSLGGFLEVFWHHTWENFPNDQMSEKGLKTEMARIKGKFPGLFEMVLFTPEGDVVTDVSDLPELHPSLGRFGRDVVSLRKGDPGPLKAHFQNYVPILGPFLSFNPKYFHRYPIGKISLGRKRAFLQFSRPMEGKPWLVAWMSVPADIPGTGIRFGLEHAFLPSQDYIREIVDFSKPPEEWGKPFGQAAPHLSKAAFHLGDEQGKIVREGGFFWSQICLTKTRKLVFCLPDHGLRRHEQAMNRLSGLTAGSYLLFLVSLNIIFGRWVQVSLHTKILFLFVFSTSVPLALLSLSANSLFHEREKIIEKRLAQENEEILWEFDRRFIEVLSLLEETTNRILGKLLPSDSRQVDIAVSAAHRLVRLLSPDLCEIIDGKGNSLFRSSKGLGEALEKISPFFGIQIARGMAELNGTDFGMKESSREQTFKASLETIGFDLDQVIMSFRVNLKRLGELKIGESTAQTLCFPMKDAPHRVILSALISWGNTTLADTGIKAAISFRRKAGDRYIAIFDDWQPSSPDFPLMKEMYELDSFTSYHRVPMHWKYRKGPEEFLMTCLIGLYKFAQPAFAAVSTASVGEEIGRTRIRLALFAFGLLFLGILMGGIVSHQLLLPIQRLSAGMEQMKQRDFSRRLPVVSDDELGRLTAMFNGIMEGMADLEIAKVVQETFFPQAPLTGNGWEVYGRSVSASRVGGDYFDYFPLKDGRWLIFIGDATGHGVSAALVVAMIKAMISHPENPTRPSEILGLLNRSLVKTLKRKRQMTGILGFFQPAEGNLEASNGGHNYPQVVRKTGIEEIIIPHPLMGFPEKLPFENRMYSLENDDWICFFTDGLIEDTDRQGTQIGYDRLQEALPGLKRGSARETESAIRAWHEGLRTPGPFPDDTTIMVLQKGAG